MPYEFSGNRFIRTQAAYDHCLYGDGDHAVVVFDKRRFWTRHHIRGRALHFGISALDIMRRDSVPLRFSLRYGQF